MPASACRFPWPQRCWPGRWWRWATASPLSGWPALTGCPRGCCPPWPSPSCAGWPPTSRRRNGGPDMTTTDQAGRPAAPATRPASAAMRLADMAAAMRLGRELIGHDHWTAEELAAHQRRRLEELVGHAIASSPFYRERYAGLGLEQGGPVELGRLPTVDKATVMERFDDLVTDRGLTLAGVEAHLDGLAGDQLLDGRYRAMATGGSTGRKGMFVADRAEWRQYLAGCFRWNHYVGLRPRLPRRLRIASIAAARPLHMTYRMAVSIDLGLYRVLRLEATAPPAAMVEALNRHQPEFLYAYASVLGLLAAEQLEGRLRIRPAAIASSGETHTQELRDAVRAAWGTSSFELYAMTEAGILGSHCDRHTGIHLFEDQAIVEVVDEAGRPVPAGQAGHKLLVTNLVTRTQPLLRYEVSDMVAGAPGHGRRPPPGAAQRPGRHRRPGPVQGGPRPRRPPRPGRPAPRRRPGLGGRAGPGPPDRAPHRPGRGPPGRPGRAAGQPPGRTRHRRQVQAGRVPGPPPGRGRALEQRQLVGGRRLGPAPAGGVGVVEQGRLEVGQERRRLGLPDRPPPGAAAGVGEEQVRPGPGHADEEQPPLLGRLGRGRLGAEPQRQQPVLAADQEHHRELQPLGGVQGEQRHPVRPRVPGVDLVAQGQLGQEAVEVVPAAGGQGGEQVERLLGGAGAGRGPGRRGRGRGQAGGQ